MTLEERLRAYALSGGPADEEERRAYVLSGGPADEEKQRVHALSGDPVDEERLRETIRVAKEAWYRGALETPVSGLEFLLRQAGYIRKRWWAAQALVLLTLWLLLFVSGTTVYARRSMGILAPLFVLLVVPELWKSQNCGCMEVEAVSYFSIRRVYAARMVWFLLTDVLLLSLFFAASALTLRVTIGEMVVQFLLPMNVTCCICFGGLCSNRSDSGYFAFGMSLVWTGIWSLVVLQEQIYQAITAPMWAAAVVLSVLLGGCSAYRVWRNCGRYWEVQVLWN